MRIAEGGLLRRGTERYMEEGRQKDMRENKRGCRIFSRNKVKI